MSTSPFDGNWTVSFYPLRNAVGQIVGSPFGENAQLEIWSSGESDLHAIVLREDTKSETRFAGTWHAGKAVSFTAQSYDDNASQLFQLVGSIDLQASSYPVGGYIRTLTKAEGSAASSDGTGSWIGTGGPEPRIKPAPRRG